VRANGEVRQVKLRARRAVNAGSQIIATDGPPPRERNPQVALAALSALASTMTAAATIMTAINNANNSSTTK
jgi:hypothetical protein